MDKDKSKNMTIKNLSQVIYSIKQIKYQSNINKFGKSEDVTKDCVCVGFSEGRILNNLERFLQNMY